MITIITQILDGNLKLKLDGTYFGAFVLDIGLLALAYVIIN